LPPGDFHADVVRGGMKRYIISGNRAMIIRDKAVVLGQTKKGKKIRLDQRASGAGRYGYNQPGMPGGERGGPGMAPGGMPGGGGGGLSIPSSEWEDLDKIGTR